MSVGCPAEGGGAPSRGGHCGGPVLVQAQWRVRAQQREGERMAALEGEWRRRDAERSEQVQAARDHYAALARRAQQVGVRLRGAGCAAARMRGAAMARQVHQVDSVRAVRVWCSGRLGVPSSSMLCSFRDELLAAQLIPPDSAVLVRVAVRLSKAVTSCWAARTSFTRTAGCSPTSVPARGGSL